MTGPRLETGSYRLIKANNQTTLLQRLPLASFEPRPSSYQELHFIYSKKEALNLT